jgi:hypothetical protein
MSLTRLGLAVCLGTLGASAWAQLEGRSSIGVGFGAYFPQSAEIRAIFGDTVQRTGLTFRRHPRRGEGWRVTNDVGLITGSGSGSRFAVIPFTYGMERHFGDQREEFRPYVRIAAGIAYHDYSILRGGGESAIRFTGQRFGTTANVELGTHITERLRLSARYNVFSKVSGFDFSGLEISANLAVAGF